MEHRREDQRYLSIRGRVSKREIEVPSSTLMRRKGAWRRRNRKQFPFYTTLNTIVLSFYIFPEGKRKKERNFGKAEIEAERGCGERIDEKSNAMLIETIEATSGLYSRVVKVERISWRKI